MLLPRGRPVIDPEVEDLVAQDDVVVIREPYGEWIRCQALVPYHHMYRNCRRDGERHRGKYLVCTSHAYSAVIFVRPEGDANAVPAI